jgi:hypothetical protein
MVTGKLPECKCGCGRHVTKEGNTYIHGHNHKGKTYLEIYGSKSKDQRHKRKIATEGKPRPDMLGNKNPAKRKEIRKKIKMGVKRSWQTKSGQKRRKEMINYQAAYMNSCVSNPSKPQKELYNLILKICPYAILNYPCLKYSIDIAIPFLNIAIEYDEPYWHKDFEYDFSRQKELETKGWKFIRYRGYIPSKIELINDMENLT